MRLRTATAALAAAALTAGGLAVAAQPSAATATITRAAVEARGAYWVKQQVPYNQGASYPANSAPTGPYRTDCSGFVSMAWGLSSSLNTQTLPSVSTQIPASQLQTGDVLDYRSTVDPVNGSHVVMFIGWANSAHTEYTEMEEAGGGLGAVERTIQFPYDEPMDGSATWTPFRYNGITGSTGSAGYSTAFQTNTEYLDVYGPTGGKTTQGMNASSSPAITHFGGGTESAFESNTNTLLVWGAGGDTNTNQGMMGGTNPSIAASGSSFEVAFQSNTGELVLWTPGGGAVHTGQGMRAGTSPSITAVPGGGYLVAFQANTGELVVYGKGHTGQTMYAGTSPSIAATAAGWEVAFEAAAGEMDVWTSSGRDVNSQQGIMHGTSPSVTADPSGVFYVAFQANTGELMIWGHGYTDQGMRAGTSPSIAATSSGYEVAFEANTGELVLWSSATGTSTHTAQGMRLGTSPAITA